MPTSPLSVVIQHLLAELRPEGDGMTDGELLARFLGSRDEAALAALVRRHAPMVWGVCCRLLHHHDAEDAFQATFLVLVRKAVSVPRQAVANWLYGVARQTAVRLRATAAKRGRRETQVVNMPEPTVAEVRDADLQTVLDEELSRLPDHYRGVVVLCDLEGMTRKEAARQLGIPEGSVASRLARARVMLARRLTNRGVALSGGALAAVLAQQATAAGVPSSVVASTIKAASLLAAGKAAATGAISGKVAALTEEVVKAMLFTKLKAAIAVVLILGFVASGATILTCRTAAGQDDKKPTAEKPVKPAAKQEEGDGVKQPEAKADGFAWGKALDKPAAYAGLQVGIGVSPKDKRTYKAGEAVKVTLKVRNAGETPITISYYKGCPLFGLVVKDEKGKQVKLLGGVRPDDAPKDLQMQGVGKAPWQQQLLKPGDEVDLGSQELGFVSPKGELTSSPRLLVSNPAMPAVPGKYKLRYVDVCLNMPKTAFNFDGLTAQHVPVKVSTGEVEIMTRGEAEGKKDQGVKQPEAKADDKAALQGTWQVVSVDRYGNTQQVEEGPQPWQKKETWVIKDNWIVSKSNGLSILSSSAVYTIRPDKTPKEIDINAYPRGPGYFKSDIDNGIYTLDGDVWKICLAGMPLHPRSGERPKEMVTRRGSEAVLITLKRVKPEQPVEKTPAEGKRDEGAKQPMTKEEKLRVLIENVLAAHGGEFKLNKLQFTMTVKHSNGRTQQYFFQPPKESTPFSMTFRCETTLRDSTTTQIEILPHGLDDAEEERGWEVVRPARNSTPDGRPARLFEIRWPSAGAAAERRRPSSDPAG